MSRLDGEASPWLRRGAAQPIAWRGFDEAAFAEGRPVLLVIGSATSHACHALDDEGFDDPEVARALGGFVAVRVDADERPDIDARYQPGALPSWPLIAVLAPDGSTRSVGLHGSRAALLRLGAGLGDSAADMNEDMNRGMNTSAAPVAGVAAARSIDEWRALALGRMEAAFDARYGGFGKPPKHPHAPALELLLDEPAPAPWARAAALRTLDAMAAGGILDQLGGGFHRYSTDDKWIVPHFEKRAVDQAGLIRAYARAFALTGEPRYAEIARAAGDWVLGRLALPGGGFAAAEDCDVGAYDDASFYTWTVDEARAVLDADEWRVAERAFDIYGRGEMHLEPTRNVLFVGGPPDAIARELGRGEAETRALLEAARRKLRAAREQRPRPELDRSRYAGAEADLARAFLQTAGVLARPDFKAAGLAALDGLYAALDEGHLIPHKIAAMQNNSLRWLPDQAELGLAALAAFAATSDSRHLAIATTLAQRIAESFLDPSGALQDRPRGSTGPAALARPILLARDGAQASGNAAAARLFAEQASRTGNAAFRARADAISAALLPLVAGEGIPSAAWLRAPYHH